MTGSLTIVPAHAVSEEDLRTVMSAAFDKTRSADWFEWKHRDAPWGPSNGLVAIDDEGPVGVRMLLPWGLTVGGTPVRAWRAIEASTVPRAQGQGVFSRLNRKLMATLPDAEPSLIFSTPNRNSRIGYQKLGWSLFRVVRHRYVPVRLRHRTAELDYGNHVLASYLQPPEPAIATAWDTTSLQWRLDERCGHQYELATLREADNPNGLAYRTLRRGPLTILLPLAVWGSRPERDTLIAAVGRRDRAGLALIPAAPRTRGERYSELAVFHAGDWTGLNVEPGRPSSWSLTFADVEGVL